MNQRLSFYNSAVATEHYLGMRWPQAVWRAVLEQAIKDVVDGPNPSELIGLDLHEQRKLGLEMQAAAQFWIDDPKNEPRRFAWVCEQLDLDPSAVRAAIERRTNQSGERIEAFRPG